MCAQGRKDKEVGIFGGAQVEKLRCLRRDSWKAGPPFGGKMYNEGSAQEWNRLEVSARRMDCGREGDKEDEVRIYEN